MWYAFDAPARGKLLKAPASDAREIAINLMNAYRRLLLKLRRQLPDAHRVIVVGYWTSLAVTAMALVALPCLWWQGGVLELSIRAFRIRGEDGLAYRVRMWPMISKNTHWSWIGVEVEDPPAWLFQVPPDCEDGQRSTLVLYEDGKALGPAHSPYEDVVAEGRGRFVHLADKLVFSASDNSNPRRNGRRYTIREFSRPRLEPTPMATLVLLWLGAIGLLSTAALRWRRVVAFLEQSQAHRPQALFALSLVAAFTVYVFFFASLRRDLALRYMVFLGIWSALFLVLSRRRIVLSRWMAWPAAFLVCSAAVLAWTSSASWTSLLDLLLSAAVGTVIYSAMHRGWTAQGGLAALLGWALCAFFAVVVALQNFGFDIKSVVAGLGTSRLLPWVHSNWNQKYQESWILVLTWIVVAALAPRRRDRWWLAGSVLAVSASALFSGYSYTAKLVFLTSIAVFFGAILAPRVARYGIALAMVGTLLLLPSLAAVSWSHVLKSSSAIDWEHGVPKHLIRRLITWEYVQELATQRRWLGWGLGTTKSLPSRKQSAEEALEDGAKLPSHLGKLSVLPGGHPHSLPLLIWVETGLAGVLLASGALLAFLHRLAGIRDRARHGALLALTVSCFMTFGLNYPAWEPTMTMMMAITAGLVGAVVKPTHGGASGVSAGGTCAASSSPG
jgi:hypothetical protein